MDLIDVISAWFAFYFRPIIKGFLRLTTRLCELQRLCYGEEAGGPRSIAVEKSLELSRTVGLKDVVRRLDSKLADESGDTNDNDNLVAFAKAVDDIAAVKKIKKELHKQFLRSLDLCLKQIWGYRRLVKEVEALRSESFDSENLRHEKSLIELWNLLQPGVPLMSRKSKEWQNIGFQGDDPKTDFRGMGLLGLENLLYFAREYNTAAKHVLSHSHHPNYGYSFAIVGINLTHMAYRLLKDGSAKSHMYNVCECEVLPTTTTTTTSTVSRRPRLRHFHHLYVYLFVEFDKFWVSMKPKDVMEFNRIRDLFENRIRDDLKSPKACFKINVAVDTV